MDLKNINHTRKMFRKIDQEIYNFQKHNNKLYLIKYRNLYLKQILKQAKILLLMGKQLKFFIFMKYHDIF